MPITDDDNNARYDAMGHIEENVLRAQHLIKSEDRGIVSDVYDYYKRLTDHTLSSDNVSLSLADETAGLLALNSAQSEALTVRDYYRESKERLMDLAAARLRDMTLDVDARKKAEIREDIERFMRIRLNDVKDIKTVNQIKQVVLNADDRKFEQLMSGYVKQAMQANEDKSPEGSARPIRPPRVEFAVPQEYNRSDLISFDEVYQQERGVMFHPGNIENLTSAKDKMSVAAGAHNKYQSFVSGIENLSGDDSVSYADSLVSLYQNYYASSPDAGAAEANLQADIAASGQNLSLLHFRDGRTLLNLSQIPDEAGRRQALRAVAETARKRQQKQLDKILQGRPIEEYAAEYQSGYRRALGSLNSARLAQAMKDDNLEVIDRVAGVGSAAGMGLMVVGGVVTLVPGGQIAGPAVTKAGSALALGSMGAKTAAGYTEALTRNEVDRAEIIGRNKDFAMDLAGFAIGSAAGSAGGKLARNMINNGTGRVAALLADKGTDFTLSLAGDLAMMGALQTQQNVEGLAENNLMGVAVSFISGTRHGLRHGSVMSNRPSDILGIKRVTMENGRYTVTSRHDVEREQIATRNHQQTLDILRAAGIEENNPAYRQYYAQIGAAVHHGRRFGAAEEATAQRIVAELQKPDMTPEKMKSFVSSYRDEVIETQQKNASGSTFDNRDESAPTLRTNINETLRSGVELRRTVNPEYPEIFYNDKGLLEDVIVELSPENANASAVGIINNTVSKYKKFNLDFDAEANQFLIKGKPVNVQKFFKGRQEQMDKFLAKIEADASAFDASDSELFKVISSGDYAKFTELKMIRGKGGDKRNMALRNALNDEILFDRFSEEMRGKESSLAAVSAGAKTLSEDYAQKSAVIGKESERGKISSQGTDLSANEIDRIEFSVRPSELAAQSTYQNWKSCMNAVGCNHRYVDDSIGQGTIIAYGFNSQNPQKKISRLLLHPYVDKNGKIFYQPNDRLYGESNTSFVNAVNQFAEHINEGKSGIFEFNKNKKAGDGLYNDNHLMGNNLTSIAQGDIDLSEAQTVDLYSVDWSRADNIKVSDPKQDIDLRFMPETVINKIDLSSCEGTIKVGSDFYDLIDAKKLSSNAKIEKSYSFNQGDEETIDLSNITDSEISIKSNNKKCNVILPDNLQNLSIVGRWHGTFSEFKGNLEVDNINAIRTFNKLKDVKLRSQDFDSYNLNTEIESLSLVKPQAVFIQDPLNVKGISIQNLNDLNTLAVLNNPNLSKQLVTPEVLSQVSIFVTDEAEHITTLLSKERPNIEMLGIKGDMGTNHLNMSQCPNLKNFGVMGVNNENTVIDLSKCKKLESIECDGDNKLKRIIVPEGFDKSSVKGLDGVEILTPSEVKAKELLAKIHETKITSPDCSTPDKTAKLMALRGTMRDSQSLFERKSVPTHNQTEAERRIQQMYARKRLVESCLA